ncbi:hypothetical protein F4821DRAFT_256470 [Hypoxylon rubiginosum]|uniref:Uncharacterized protein n=1 Tax=Hypoxylon rubiginosum TaxID=110542 RepID=A0ACC0DBH6_9PEZI|nr:hypothetical protein F4821DRAFT_256470 [Hypoxylon rubiginosum]
MDDSSGPITPIMWARTEEARRQIRYAVELMCEDPSLWFGDMMSSRLWSLITSPLPTFLDYSLREKFPFLDTITYQDLSKVDTFVHTDWSRQNDELCELAFARGGATVIGYARLMDDAAFQRAGTRLRVQIDIHPNSGIPCSWGNLWSPLSNALLARGPPQTCPDYPWDAMVIYDCEVCSTDLSNVPEIAGYKWDILLLKNCDEEFQYPWHVVKMRSAPIS